MTYKDIIGFYSKQDTETKVLWSLFATFLFWLMCLNHTDPFNVSITYNTLDGRIGFQTNGGWHVTSPFVRTSEVPAWPGRVSLLQSSKSKYERAVDDKIVKFILTEEALTEFVKLQGFHYSYTHSTLILHSPHMCFPERSFHSLR